MNGSQPLCTPNEYGLHPLEHLRRDTSGPRREQCVMGIENETGPSRCDVWREYPQARGPGNFTSHSQVRGLLIYIPPGRWGASLSRRKVGACGFDTKFIACSSNESPLIFFS